MDLTIIANPPAVAFGASVVAGLSRIRVEIHPRVIALVSGYLLIAIGVKGGAALSTSVSFSTLATIALAMSISAVTPMLVLPVLRSWVGLDKMNAAAVAAHYGSISIVTFTVATAFLEGAGHTIPAYAVAMAASMELPAILTAFATIGNKRAIREFRSTALEVITGRASVLLLVGLLTGFAISDSLAIELVVTPFNVMLTVFLAIMGIKVAQHIGDLRVIGGRLALFAVLTPLLLGSSTAIVTSLVGLGVATSTILATLAASASYIAAPAAVSKGIPQASPAIYLSPPLAITFPFNIVIGIVVYYQISNWITG